MDNAYFHVVFGALSPYLEYEDAYNLYATSKAFGDLRTIMEQKRQDLQAHQKIGYDKMHLLAEKMMARRPAINSEQKKMSVWMMLRYLFFPCPWLTTRTPANNEAFVKREIVKWDTNTTKINLQRLDGFIENPANVVQIVSRSLIAL